MTFDAIHPSGAILFRSGHGGVMQGLQLREDAMSIFPDAATFAEAILLTANVSHTKAAIAVRDSLVALHKQPSAAMPTRDDLEDAENALRNHHYR